MSHADTNKRNMNIGLTISIMTLGAFLYGTFTNSTGLVNLSIAIYWIAAIASLFLIGGIWLLIAAVRGAIGSGQIEETEDSRAFDDSIHELRVLLEEQQQGTRYYFGRIVSIIAIVSLVYFGWIITGVAFALSWLFLAHASKYFVNTVQAILGERKRSA